VKAAVDVDIDCQYVVIYGCLTSSLPSSRLRHLTTMRSDRLHVEMQNPTGSGPLVFNSSQRLRIDWLARRSLLRDLFSLADVRAVEVLEDVVGKTKVPLARRVVAIAVQPDLGAVGRLVAVDVEIHLGVGDGCDPAG
jgi:hypothetical protein